MSVGAIRMAGAFVEIFGDDRKLQRTLAGAQRRLKTWSSNVAAIGRQLGAMGLMGTTALGLSARTFATFEQAMSRVKAVTGATETEFAALNAQARELGASTVFTATEAAQAMGMLATAGFKTNDILAAMPGVLDLAAAGQVEIAEAADVAAKAMNNMGIQAREMSRVADLMAKAAGTGLPIHDLGEALKFAGPMAHQAGMSLDELVSALQILHKAGIRGEMGGTAMRGMIMSLSTPSEEAAVTMRTLGVSVKDAYGDFRPFVDIVDDLGRALSGMGSADRLNILGTIFADRQASGAAELITTGAEEMRRNLSELQINTGESARFAGVQLDNLAGDVEKASGALQELQINLTSTYSDTLRRAARAVAEHLNLTSKWISENRDLTIAIAAGTLAIGGVGIALIGVAGALKTVSIAVGAVKSIFGLASVAVFAFTNPLGMVLTTLGLAAGAAFYLSDGMETISQAFRGASDALKAGDLKLAAEIAFAGIEVAWLKMIDVMRRAWIELATSISKGPLELALATSNMPDFAKDAIRGGFGVASSVAAGTESKAVTDAQSRLNFLTESAAIAAASRAINDALAEDSAEVSGLEAGQTFAADFVEGVFDPLPELEDEIDTRMRDAERRNNFDAVDSRSAEGLRTALNAIQPADQSRRLDTMINRLERIDRDIRRAPLLQVRRA